MCLKLLKPVEDLIDEERHQARVEDILGLDTEPQSRLFEQILQLAHLEVNRQELVHRRLQVSAVKSLLSPGGEVGKSLQDANLVPLNDLLLAGDVMAHLQQDELAVKNEHLTGRVVLRLARARHTLELRSGDGRFGVALVRLQTVLNDFQVVEPLGEMRVLRLCQQVQSAG